MKTGKPNKIEILRSLREEKFAQSKLKGKMKPLSKKSKKPKM
jgi:hypothetical protein